MRVRRVKFRVISTVAGTIKVAQAAPSSSPVRNRLVNVFAQIPVTPRSQSTPIGTNDRNSQIREIGSMSSIRRQNG